MSKTLLRYFIYSTLACDNLYTNYAKGGGDLPVPADGAVLVKGGTGVADNRFVTPRGVITEVSPEQLAYLSANSVFNLHKENGYIVVEESKKDIDEVVAAEMQSQDGGAQLTDESFKEDANAPAPSTADTGKTGGKPGKGK